MKWWWLLGLWPALGVADLPVVKVRSTLCRAPAQASRVGSGVLIESGQETFVVTSSHVLFHGDQADGICHEISGALTAKATLVAVDFTKGLALLRPDRDSKSGVPLTLTPNPSGPVTIAGFPFASDTVNVDTRAQVINAWSSRSVIPRVRTLAEVKGHAEYGMSGGGLFSEPGELLGILSHQFVKLAGAGDVGAVREFAPLVAMLPVAPELVALVIPNAEVVKWVQSAAEGKPGFNFREDLKGQINRKVNSTGLGGLKFTQPRSRGGDGVGIGGTAVSGSGDAPVAIELNLDSASVSQDWPFAAGSWRERALRRMRAGAKLSITGFEKSGAWFAVPEMMTAFAWIDQGYEPLIRVVGSPVDDLSVAERKLSDLGREVERYLAPLKEGLVGDLAQLELWDSLNLLTEVIRNTQYELIREKCFDEWLEPVPDSPVDLAWVNWFNRNFEATTQLKARLYRIREELRKLRV